MGGGTNKHPAIISNRHATYLGLPGRYFGRSPTVTSVSLILEGESASG